MTMTTVIQFRFGAGQRHDGTPITTADCYNGLQRVLEQVAYYFNGYSSHEVVGGWRNNEGVLVEEPGYIVEVIDREGPPVSGADNRIAIVVATILSALGQQEVWVTTQEVGLRRWDREKGEL